MSTTPPAKITRTTLRTPLPKLRPFNADSWGLGCSIFFEIARSALKGRASKNYGSCPSENLPLSRMALDCDQRRFLKLDGRSGPYHEIGTSGGQ